MIKDDVIPGVSQNSEFVKWISSRNIQLHPNLSIGRSKLGGIGLQFDNQTNPITSDKDLEILRIPQDVTIDYMTLLNLLQSLKSRDQRPEFSNVALKESELLVTMLTVMEPSTETQIILAYLVGIKALRNMKDKSEYYNDSPLAMLDPYLEILLNTSVLEYVEDDTSDPFISRLAADSQQHKSDYENIVESVNTKYKKQEFQFSSVITFKTYFQLLRAVRSRTLEIPHQEEGSDDFVTNVTLVPILDFANHHHYNNSYFDVDRADNSVVLRLKSEYITPENFEITISYSPVESIQNFISTYGFIPGMSPNNQQLLELKLQLPSEDLVLKAKWLGAVPQVQLVISPESIAINLEDNILPSIYLPGLEYNVEWLKLAPEAFRNTNGVPDTVQDSEILDLLQHQESHFEIINGVPPIGLLYHNQPIEDELDVTSECISRATSDIINYCRQYVDDLQSQTQKVSVLDDYIKLQIRVLQQLISEYDKGKTVVLQPGHANKEWSEYLSPPKQIMLG